jgi:ABC-type sugar transport system permease subunit
MDINRGIEEITRNPQTAAQHRRESFWQIIFPLLIAVLVIIALLVGVIFSATQPASEVGRWADVSLIWLIAPALVFVFLFLVILAGLVYAVSLLLGKLPHYAAIAQYYMQLVASKAHHYSNLAAEPIVKTETFWAAVRWIGRRGKKDIE